MANHLDPKHPWLKPFSKKAPHNPENAGKGPVKDEKKPNK
jgi:hypothetical protein